MKRVVVTGMGAVTPLGNSFNDSWQNAKKGNSGIGGITRFNAEDLPWKTAGEVRDFNPLLYMSAKELMRSDPFAQYALAAAVMAAGDAGLSEADFGQDTGVIMGSSRGGITTIEKEMQKLYSAHSRSSRRLSPFLMPSSTIGMAASCAAKRLSIKGVCLGISNACSSGAIAVGEAFRLIRHGGAPLVFAGGTEAPICRLCVEGYGAAGAISKKKGPSACKPFGKGRDGFVIAEGATVLVLEELSAAEKRGVRIYAEVAGYGNTSDAYHMTRPDPEGEARSIAKAIKDAGIDTDDIDHINAHGASTRSGDKAESEAIHKVFGKRAGEIPVSAMKALTGHMLAASGAFEAACTAMTISEGFIPSTPHMSEKDIECDLNLVTEGKKAEVRTAITQSFGFGGTNAALVMRRYL